MEFLGYVIYAIGLLLAISWLFGIRMHIAEGKGVAMQTVNTTLLFFTSLALIPALNLSPLHLLWMYPVSLVIGMLSLAFPFSLLSVFGNVLARIACIGLRRT